jgi:membrane-associated protein
VPSTTLLSILPDWLNPEVLLSGLTPTVVAVLCLIIFVESSVFPVLPGDSLLFTAGLFIANGTLQAPLWLVCVLVTVSALLGNAVGYAIGYKVGPALFNRPDSRFFKQEYVDKTHVFLEKHGPKAIILARFVPFVRTFITWIAGIGRMDPKKYFTYTVIGGILWAAGITILGALLGRITFIKNNVDAIFVVIVLFSVIPILLEYLKGRREKKAAAGGNVTGGNSAAGDPAAATQQLPRVQTDGAAVTQRLPRIDR